MWNDLVTTALVGTERRALDLQSVPEDFHELARQLEGQDSERALLALAGAMTLHHRVGEAPALDTSPLLEPCDLDDLPPCSPRAGLLLQQILVMPQHKPHLQEWLNLAADRGQRVSDEYLPLYMNNLNRSALPDHFFDVLGKRGRWLAQQNESWSYAVLPLNDAEWESASFPARIEYLRSLRASDPAHGRALVESVWKSEKADNRATMIQTFDINLSLEDEPFLEAALDDRARNVGLYAASVLKNLDGSAYRQRMIQRAQALLNIHWKKERRNRKLVIVVTLPETCDESMIRDGIDPNPRVDSKRDMYAYWLFRILDKLPLSSWLSSNGQPADLVEAANDTEAKVKSYLHSTFAHRAIYEHDDAFALALFENAGVVDHFKSAALGAMSPAIFEKSALRALEHDQNVKGDGSLLSIISLSAYNWSPSLTAAFLNRVAHLLPQQNPADVIALTHCPSNAEMRMSPYCVEQLRALASIGNKSQPTWTHVVKRTVSTLEFRRELHKEFAR